MFSFVHLFFCVACSCFPCDSTCASCAVGDPEHCLSCNSTAIYFLPDFTCESEYPTYSSGYYCFDNLCVSMLSISPNSSVIPSSSELSLLAIFDTRYYRSDRPSVSASSYTWKITSLSSASISSSTLLKIGQTQSSLLELPSYALPAGVYQIDCLMQIESPLASTSTVLDSYATVTVSHSDLVPIIDGGSRSVSTERFFASHLLIAFV